MELESQAKQPISETLFSVNLNPKQIVRLWGKITRGNPNECWPWTRCKNELGYGCVFLFGQCQLAHRVVFALEKGSFPKALKVCHSCDNPSCCNPAHLWLGTDADNVADRDSKGRLIKGKTYHGGAHINAKLTDQQALEIRSLYASGAWFHRELGEQFGVSSATIQRIIAGTRWKHL